jgi:hypothetical protein
VDYLARRRQLLLPRLESDAAFIKVAPVDKYGENAINTLHKDRRVNKPAYFFFYLYVLCMHHEGL